MEDIYNFFTKYPQATCFGPSGPSSGLTYEQVRLTTVHFGIPNCYKDIYIYYMLVIKHLGTNKVKQRAKCFKLVQHTRKETIKIYTGTSIRSSIQ